MSELYSLETELHTSMLTGMMVMHADERRLFLCEVLDCRAKCTLSVQYSATARQAECGQCNFVNRDES